MLLLSLTAFLSAKQGKWFWVVNTPRHIATAAAVVCVDTNYVKLFWLRPRLPIHLPLAESPHWATGCENIVQNIPLQRRQPVAVHFTNTCIRGVWYSKKQANTNICLSPAATATCSGSRGPSTATPSCLSRTRPPGAVQLGKCPPRRLMFARTRAAINPTM